MSLFSKTGVATLHIFRRNVNLYAPEFIFSSDNVEKCMKKFRNMRPIRLQAQEPNRKAAVLIPICVVNGKVSLLYTLRAPHLKAHRGQVSYPGGMQDIKDKSLTETALRETEEELGIKQENIEIWGTGNVIVTRNDMVVLPVVGKIKGDLADSTLQINPHEVEEVFTVSLQDLCHPKHTAYTQFRSLYYSYSMPVFLGGKRRIWGLTAVITNVFLRALLPLKAYNHKIHFNPPIKANGSKLQQF
ncbi:nucleoside diphosphate-linked moiety X motif 8 [Agrilus planipennis]|uniref:Nucleoside diphosphate-linked moiety X motif 8 n=1 Tax=Agrilus planipennis TaxID=224129 RepID=A0A1W4WJT2_AGRPL|nr:nucleoside diphosphate-linked moiety X motif 8 [Agrilus planipennis]